MGNDIVERARGIVCGEPALSDAATATLALGIIGIITVAVFLLLMIREGKW